MRDAKTDVTDLFEVEELEERFEMRWIDVGGGGGGGGGNPDCGIYTGTRNPACPQGTPNNP